MSTLNKVKEEMEFPEVVKGYKEPYLSKTITLEGPRVVSRKKFLELKRYKEINDRLKSGLSLEINKPFYGSTYGKLVKDFKWSHFATIRPNIKLNEFTAERIAKVLYNRVNVSNVFYSVEKDLNDDFYHMHLLFNSPERRLSKRDVAMMIGYPKNTGFVPYLDFVDNNSKKIGGYMSKHMGTPKQLTHGFFKKK